MSPENLEKYFQFLTHALAGGILTLLFLRLGLVFLAR